MRDEDKRKEQLINELGELRGRIAKLESQLVKAQKMESIGVLASGIAHDFNNMLAAIVGYTQVANVKLPEGSNVKQYLNKVLQASQRAKDLVNQILAFSRQREHDPIPIKISPIVKEALKLMRASLPSTIQIRQHIDKNCGTVNADSTKIHQVLMNLCTNAYNAMREDGGILEVRLHNFDIDSTTVASYSDLVPGSYVRMTVRDTGHGLAPEVLEKIFEPYFTTNEKNGGTGLGLSVVHGIVRGYGGTITVESKPGKGTTVQVFLPRLEQTIETSESEATEPLPTGHECILLIDDELALADTGKEILEHLGYTVIAKTNVMDALELFRTQSDKFDLVITDTTMPNMTGDNLARELMNIRSDVPVILCTGFSERVNESEAKEMGIKELLMKPIVMRDLAKVVRKVLSERPAT